MASTSSFDIYESGYGTNIYTVKISSDFWQTDTKLNVTVRLTLKTKFAEPFEKNAYINDVNNRIDFRLIRKDVNSSWSGHYYIGQWIDYPILFKEEGDFWEQTFQITPQWDVEIPRGEEVTVKLSLSLSIKEYPANETDPSTVPYLKQHTILITCAHPFELTLSRPFISSFEIIAGGGVVAVSVLGFVLIVYFRSRKLSRENAFSTFFAGSPFLAKLSCSVIIVGLWAFLFPIQRFLSIMFGSNFFVAFLFMGGYVVASIILTVGLFEFVLEDWNFLQIGLAFLIAMFIVLIPILVMVYWESIFGLI